MTAWTPLLDRLEERLRRIGEQVDGGHVDGGQVGLIGPPPEAADRPSTPPDEGELLRLHALDVAHDRLEARLRARRLQLQQAERYHLQTGG